MRKDTQLHELGGLLLEGLLGPWQPWWNRKDCYDRDSESFSTQSPGVRVDLTRWNNPCYLTGLALAFVLTFSKRLPGLHAPSRAQSSHLSCSPQPASWRRCWSDKVWPPKKAQSCKVPPAIVLPPLSRASSRVLIFPPLGPRSLGHVKQGNFTILLLLLTTPLPPITKAWASLFQKLLSLLVK